MEKETNLNKIERMENLYLIAEALHFILNLRDAYNKKKNENTLLEIIQLNKDLIIYCKKLNIRLEIINEKNIIEIEELKIKIVKEVNLLCSEEEIDFLEVTSKIITIMLAKIVKNNTQAETTIIDLEEKFRKTARNNNLEKESYKSNILESILENLKKFDLNNSKNHNNQPAEKIKELKNLLISFYTKETKKIERSSIDKTRMISNETWTLSIARKINGFHREHAFLILEGKKNNTYKVWFFDFVGPRGKPWTPGTHNGEIRLWCSDNRKEEFKNELEKNLVYTCNRGMMDIRKGDKIISKSWNISNNEGERLIKSITKAINEKQPKFHIAGKHSAIAIGSGTTSSNSIGHNCFTWAKEQVNNLNNKNVKIDEDIYRIIFSRTSSFLPNQSTQEDISNIKSNTFWYQKPVETIGTIITTTGLIGTAIAVGITLTQNM